jgi:alanine-synthesizing transaminase
LFSSRLQWDLRPNRLAQALNQKRRSGGPILDLTESNPTHAGFSYPASMVEPLADPRGLRYDPTPSGLAGARRAIAGYYAERGVEVQPGRILVTASTSESYSQLFKLLANPGDHVLAPRPSYPLFEYLASLESVRVTQYSLAYHGRWSIDFDSLSAGITERTRAVVVVNPNNPTGSFLKSAEWTSLARICSDAGLAVISDEVFSDYVLRPDQQRVSTLSGYGDVLTFCLSGLSKVAGLPQMKLGWIVAGGPAHLWTAALQSLELIADTYLSVSTPVQYALPKLLDCGRDVFRQISDRVRENLAVLARAIALLPSCAVLDVEGGWYATVRVPRIRTEEEWCLELLERDSVLVQPGFFYDFESEAFLVLSLLTMPHVFRAGIERIASRLAGARL